MMGPLRTLARFADGGLAAERAEREKMKNEPHLDPTLARSISKRLGPGFQWAYKPTAKRFIRTDFPLNLMGRYYFPLKEGQEPPDPFFYPYKETERGQQISDYLRPEGDTIYNFGTHPSASTLAHEYRHRAGVRGEFRNRLYDGLYAQTPEDWAEAVDMWRDYKGNDMSLEDAEKDFLSTLRSRDLALRDDEWESAPENEKPEVSDPSFWGWVASWFGPRAHYAWRSPNDFEKFASDNKARGGLAVLRRRP